MKTFFWAAVACVLQFGHLNCFGVDNFNITLNSSALVGNPTGPFSLDFQLADGSGTGDGNNTVTISDFNFHGGSWTGPSVVTMTDNSFFSEATYQFVPGGVLSFDVSMTTAVDAGGTPDEFSFDILDNSLSEIPTVGLGDAMVAVAIDSANPTVQVFGSDLTQTTINIPSPTVNYAYVPDSGIPLWMPGVLFASLCFLKKPHKVGAMARNICSSLFFSAIVAFAASAKVDAADLSANPLASRPSPPQPKALAAQTIVSGAGSYCASIGGSTFYESISSVDVTQNGNTLTIVVTVYIANPTGCTAGNPCPVYDDSPESVNVWIDFNGDGVFEAQELVLAQQGSGYLNINYNGDMQFIATIDVPQGAVANTKLRANLAWGYDATDPCTYSWAWGNVVNQAVTLNVAKVGVTQLAASQNVPIQGISNPIWQNAFDGSGNMVQLVAPESVADAMNQGSFQITATLDGYPQKPSWNPSVSYSWTLDDGAGSTLNGQGSFSGWLGQLAIDAPQNIGIYSFSLTFNIQDPNGNQIGSQSVTHKLYNILGQPLPTVNPPKQVWLQKATQWAAGADDTDSTENYLVSGIYGGAKGLGWLYRDGNPPPPWQALVEGAASQGNCVTYSDLWNAMAQVLGVQGTSIIPTKGQYDAGFVTKPATALDGFAGNAHAAGGPIDKWVFGMHQLGTGSSGFYDPTFGDVNTGLFDFIQWQGLPSEFLDSQGHVCQNLTDGHYVCFLEAEDAQYPWGNNEYHSPAGNETLSTPGTAGFTGVHSATATDSTGDGFFDSLQIISQVAVTNPGLFTVFGRLSANGQLISSRASRDSVLMTSFTITNNQIGNIGATLAFSGEDIYKSGLNGPYTVTLSLLDANGVLIGHDIFNTGAFTAAQFGEASARFSSVTISGLDTDGDSLFNYLQVQANIQAYQAMTYAVSGTISVNGTNIVSAQQTNALLVGPGTIALLFDGPTIHKSGLSGPYTIQLSLLDQNGRQSDATNLTSAVYTPQQFDGSRFLFQGPYSDTPIDTNGNGLYDFLAFHTSVNVATPSNYNIMAWLQDTSHHTLLYAKTNLTLLSGVYPISILFDGRAINQTGINGPYTVSYLLAKSPDGSTADSARNVYTTPAYLFSQFESPAAPLAQLTGQYNETATDTNGNGLYDLLTIGVQVLSGATGNLVVQAHLQASDGTDLGYATSYTNVHAGATGWVMLSFSGRSIFASGENGPYILTKVRAFNTGDPTQSQLVNNAYSTHAYLATQFDPVAAVRGTIKYSNGTAIGGAVISASGATPVYSTAAGKYNFGFAQGGAFTVGVTSPPGVANGPWQFFSNNVPIGTGQSSIVTVGFGSAVQLDAVLSANATDVSSQVSITRSGFVYNRTTKMFVQNVTVKNVGSTTLSGPISLVLDSLSSDATLFNATGATSAVPPAGSPYVNLTLATSGTLAPSGSTTVPLQFNDPTSQGITYNTRVLAGSGNR